MDYFYGAVWFALSVILFTKYRKENWIFKILSAFFFFMGIWWVADASMAEYDLMSGAYSMIFRGIAAVMLIICAVFYYKNSKEKRG